ncbi:MAG: M3 family oligoendopeptidase [Verrucomicrobiae bacterium]|nr:M3 family oligoendopeptidase [Verrucomicrobiae bacterium]
MKLPPRPRRKFLPEQFDPADLHALVARFRELECRPLPDLPSVLRWFEETQELAAATGEHAALCHIRKSVNTRDAKARNAYLRLVRKLQPAAAPWWDRLSRRLLAHPQRARFPKRWALMLRRKQVSVDLFRKENVPLEREIEEKADGYARLMAGLQVEFDGRKQTLSRMGIYLERPDCSMRERAWRAVAERRRREAEKIETTFDALLKLRHCVARNAGFENYRDYAHAKFCRFDYRVEDCFRFHAAVEKVVLPAVRALHARRAREMEFARLRPWDFACDPKGRPPLKPFADGRELAPKAARVFDRLDPTLARQFRGLMHRGLLDLDNRPFKEPGGYQCTLDESRVPFIFMNAVGRDGDVRTLFHEAGHAFHMLAARDKPVLEDRQAPMEFCEVASMTMEFLANRHAAEIYPKPEDRKRSERMLFEEALRILPWIATVDAFQHWLYTHPNHARRARRAAWLQILRRFDDGGDWSGLEEERAALWHRQLHLFHYPFYYIEYGIAQMGALGLWRKSLRDPRGTLAAYRRALTLGGTVGLKALFRAAGLSLDFRRKSFCAPVRAVLAQLGISPP